MEKWEECKQKKQYYKHMYVRITHENAHTYCLHTGKCERACAHTHTHTHSVPFAIAELEVEQKGTVCHQYGHGVQHNNTTLNDQSIVYGNNKTDDISPFYTVEI